jgi:hypothetical protein
MPDAYGPFTLSGIDPKTSPFFSNFALLIRCRVCLQARLKEPTLQVNKQELDQQNSELKADQDKLQADQKVVDGGKLPEKDLNAKMVEIADLKNKIDELQQKIKASSAAQSRAAEITGLLATMVSFINRLMGNSNASGSNQGSNQAANQGSNQGSNQPTQAQQSQSGNTVPPIAAVLAADGLARELGIKADGTGGSKPASG